MTQKYPRALDEMLELSLEHHRRDITSAASIDNKAVAIGVAAILVLGLVLGRVVDAGFFDKLMVAASLIMFVASVGSVFRVLGVRDFIEQASAKALLDDYWDAEPQEVKYSVLYYAGEAECHNAKLLKDKRNWLDRAIFLATAEVVFLVLWVVF